MAPARQLTGRAAAGAMVLGVVALAGCADRLEIPEPHTYAQVDTMKQWAEQRAEPYGVPARQLQAYAYAAHAVESHGGCTVGWPTLAALGGVLTDHGRAANTNVGPDGVTSQPLREIAPAANGALSVPDTDGGRYDGDATKDVPMGPMQLMPSRWEQFARAAEPGATPNPDNIDDAALTTAIIICSSGDIASPDGWTAALAQFNPHPLFLTAVHDKAQEFSR